ncbi:Para-aminobenzoate synthase, component I [Erythrobacter sp. NAP1]|uniref:aminodeoxychorismate synthase component I n=1 Tax=Erythrobacter sp. NAP1 TaxID=237727 RepID=UPI000068787F|nr:aminodeoxychorismate synthase component I [Erythrobacter sp. NAP1]EAQ28745.1 Para-aminobenzoate synthase, component I [Erythrobacter sp. NAP1]
MGQDAEPHSFVLLDDARAPDGGAADALYYENPRETFIAYRPDEVADALEAAEQARKTGGELAGYIAYEAGLALEDRLAPPASARSGAGGALVWLGLFDAPSRIPAADVPSWLATRGEGPASLGPLDPQLSPGGYETAFETLREAIHAGDIYQANLTYPLAGSYRGDPQALYASLRGAANAGYGGVVFDGSHWLLSFSPELFVALDEDGKAKAKPMKGTRPRSSNAEQDTALAEELASSVKDKAENLMIVDLMRNDLSRVAVPGTVRVDSPFAVESYPTVHQMVSSVRAQLAQGMGAMDLVRALFPCGSITGAPKIRAMELIGEVERDARGPYCGAIGRIGSDGAAAFNVAIRTLRLTPVENGQGDAVLGVGSAIVADSDPLGERRECEVKAGFIRRSSPDLFAPGFDLIETMSFDPETGIALLELHLARMKKSAAALGFQFDRHALRNQIQALCFELEEPVKLRLLASRSGASALETQPMPAPFEGAVKVAALPSPLDPSDWRLSHKTTDRGFYEDALEAAREHGAQEAVLVRDDGLVTEGSFTNIFVERDGVLLTPPASLGLLPGVLREYLIEKGQAREAELTLGDLTNGFQLGNAVRGLFSAELI